MKKLIPCAFALVAALLVLVFFCRNLFVKENTFSRAKVIIPLVNNAQEKKDRSFSEDDDTAQKSFIQLANDETLIGTTEFDINGDGFDDQINIVKTSANRYIQLIVGLYSPERGTYTRDCFLGTPVSQVRTFACTGMDVIGNHKNSLVYQGVDDKGRIILKIFNGKTDKNGKFSLALIGEFEADGTIFIQQDQRPESYELSKTKGASFPVWVYTSENSEGSSESALLDQIQTMYEWNEQEQFYQPVKTVRVAGNRVAAKELAKIQDGTVATFGKFLDGLWYKTENSGKSIRYIFFDYTNSEIIFEFEDSEEVYSWLNSNLRRNGIYFSAVNKSIENLQRRFDISLVNIDEIRIKLQDDVRMLISESTSWDGNYKKFISADVSKEKGVIENESLKLLLEQKNWISSNDEAVFLFVGSSYVAQIGKNVQTGRFVVTEVAGNQLLQFRSSSDDGILNGYYELSFPDAKNGGKNALVFHRVSINPEGFYREQSSPLVLKKYTPPKEDEVEKQPEVQSYSQSEQKTPAAPKLSVGISPRYFSPDGDGEYDVLNIIPKIESGVPIASWSFVVYDSESGASFWSVSGKGIPPEKIVWDGKSARGELVQSATDYPYVFTVTDSNGASSSAKGFVQVDVLVIKEGNKLKLQVPSIVFRAEAADFKSDADVRSDPNWNGRDKGLDATTLENNMRVLNRISEILKKFQGYTITVEGNANNLSGTDQEEAEIKELSAARAKYVMDWLIKDGIDAKRLKAVGNGSKNPVTRSAKIEDKWKNRRVEFILEKNVPR